MKYSFVFLLCAFTSVYAESKRLAPVFDNSTYSGGGARNSVSSKGTAGKISNNSMYEILGRLEQMQLELQQLRGIVEEQSHRIKSLDDKQNNIYSDFDHRFKEAKGSDNGGVGVIGDSFTHSQTLTDQPDIDVNNQTESFSGQTGQAIDQRKPSSQVVVPSTVDVANKVKQAKAVANKDIADDKVVKKTVTPNAGQSSGSQNTVYQAAYEKLRNGHNTEAITQFKQLLTSFPDGEFASKSQYWLGEAYKLTNDLKSAKRAYAKVISHYGRSSRVPDALLKLGFIELEQHNKVSARDYLSQITVKYPDSTAAHLAKKKLMQMEEK